MTPKEFITCCSSLPQEDETKLISMVYSYIFRELEISVSYDKISIYHRFYVSYGVIEKLKTPEDVKMLLETERISRIFGA
jgi:hypothetical protein